MGRQLERLERLEGLGRLRRVGRQRRLGLGWARVGVKLEHRRLVQLCAGWGGWFGRLGQGLGPQRQLGRLERLAWLRDWVGSGGWVWGGGGSSGSWADVSVRVTGPTGHVCMGIFR